MYRRNSEKYAEVVGESRLDRMKAFCDENDICEYAEFVDYCMRNNMDWFKTVSSYGGTRAMQAYFRKKRRVVSGKERMEGK